MWLRDAGDAGVKGAGERERGLGDERLDEQVWLRSAGGKGEGARIRRRKVGRAGLAA